jgi:hypothetical protein
MKKSEAMAVRHTSGTAEHFTPPGIVAMAREALGGITLDPASCAEANAWIKAERFYSTREDGFIKPWHGRVFLNPPGGMSDNKQRLVKIKCRETGSCGLPVGHTHEGIQANQKKWWFKLIREYVLGDVRAAIFVCFSVELLQNTQCGTPTHEGKPLPIPLDFPICYPARRVPYVKPGGGVGKSPPHASAIVYVCAPGAAVRFVKTFSALGRVVVPASV